mgnify:CR=1 FL=1
MFPLKKLSATGLILAALYLVFAIVILLLSSNCRGEGCVMILFVTFPWFFLFLNSSGGAAFYIISLSLNAVLFYLLGRGCGKLAARLFRRGR